MIVHETGGTDNPKALCYETKYPRPTLIPGHAIVKNQYSGINFIDTYHRSGLYKRTMPFICGQEGGGTIDALSYDEYSHSHSHSHHDDTENEHDVGSRKQEQQFKIGDTVVYSSFETYSEYTLVPISKLIHVPSTLHIKQAIACLVQGLTAHYLVTSAHADLIQVNDWCLIYSVGSGTCQWAAQMAKLRGYKVIGTCSKSKVSTSQEQHDRIASYCDELIVLDEVEGMGYSNYDSVDILKRIMEITNGKGVNCVIDGVGKSTSEISLNCLARRGVFISFGNSSGKVDDLSLLRLVAKSAYVTRPKLNDYVVTRDELLQRIHEIFDWMKEGKLHVSIDEEFELKDAAKAHNYIQAGKTRGKLLLKIS